MNSYDNYPADIRNYDHDPRSPFYTDYSEDLDELTIEELRLQEHLCISTSEDPDVPSRGRHAAELYLGAIQCELERRYRLEIDEEE